jgi:hypothetical protein
MDGPKTVELLDREYGLSVCHEPMQSLLDLGLVNSCHTGPGERQYAIIKPQKTQRRTA